MRIIIVLTLLLKYVLGINPYSCGSNGYQDYLKLYPSKCGNDCDKYAEYGIFYICEIVNTLKLMKHLA